MYISTINHNSNEYKIALKIRDECLRKPLGLSIYSDNLELEAEHTHIVCFVENEICGTLVVVKYSNTTYKIRQVAVSAWRRGIGIGTKIMKYAEQYIKSLGGNKIIIDARVNSLDFYIKMQYKIEGCEFLQLGIPHIKMRKII